MILSVITWRRCDGGENGMRVAEDQFQLTIVTMQSPNARIVGRKPAGKKPMCEYTLHIVRDHGNKY